ncbi:TIGR00730 family Rossman fold protein [Flavobacterium sp. LC2016-01]|uniref:LOG family protein n=1 Tax=Flavobacterium sp. LC2016-01 TaxID=2675876 RepID=UPI0012BAE1E8|nr:TIGR00730 family Rossman fold protein [Flavobacterium sp. LC2016-01]MTH17628.1 TIGR00730 family Rossman fold protein [Flavobacterium sp. LC2016-01]
MKKRIAVFCGSGFGNEFIFKETACSLGKLLSQKDFGLVYGGSSTGLMGAVADGVLENNGEVIGVLPQFLQKKEVAHQNLTELILVDDMHQRKAKMNLLADGFIVLPGGLGTLEELFEMLTWFQLGLHQKKIVLLNIKNFYAPLLIMIENLENFDFLKSKKESMFFVCDSVEACMDIFLEG